MVFNYKFKTQIINILQKKNSKPLTVFILTSV